MPRLPRRVVGGWARALVITVPGLLFASSLWAVPMTDFVHTLSPDEFTTVRGVATSWQSPVFSFGENVTFEPGDSLHLHVEFSGTQFLQFGDSGAERVGVGGSNPVFSREFTVGGVWNFLGVTGDLTRNGLGVRISNVPILVVDESLVDPLHTVTFTGVDVTLVALDTKTGGGSLTIDGFTLGVLGGNMSIGGSPNAAPGPGTLPLLVLGSGLLLVRRRRGP